MRTDTYKPSSVMPTRRHLANRQNLQLVLFADAISQFSPFVHMNFLCNCSFNMRRKKPCNITETRVLAASSHFYPQHFPSATTTSTSQRHVSWRHPATSTLNISPQLQLLQHE